MNSFEALLEIHIYIDDSGLMFRFVNVAAPQVVCFICEIISKLY